MCLWDLKITAFCFYVYFTQCPNLEWELFYIGQVFGSSELRTVTICFWYKRSLKNQPFIKHAVIFHQSAEEPEKSLQRSRVSLNSLISGRETCFPTHIWFIYVMYVIEMPLSEWGRISLYDVKIIRTH